MKKTDFLSCSIFQKPFKNTVLPDEDYASLKYHIQAMENYMIKVNSGQKTPDNGRREIFNEHFAEVRRLNKVITMPMPIQYAMASVYQTHPAFAEARRRPPEPPPAPLPSIDVNLDVELSDFHSAEELNEYVAALGNLAIASGEQIQPMSEEDQQEIIQVIEIMENEPHRFPRGYGINEVKSYYQALFRMLEVNEGLKRVTVQIAVAHQKRWKQNKLN